jgi:hypothetical protein
MYKKKIQNEPIRLFIIEGVSTNNFFTWMLLIQNLIRFYNIHLHSDPFKKESFVHVIYCKNII